jgi:hypothetical protein
MGTELVLKASSGEGGNGHHDRAAWRGAVELFDRWLALCDEFDGQRDGWKMVPLAMVKMKSSSRWKCRHFDRDKCIIAMRAAGNDSVWEFAVRPPEGVTTMLAGTIATLWNGWSGHRVPDAYRANRSHEEEHEEDVQATPPAALSPPVLPAPTAPPVTNNMSLLDMLTLVQSRVQEAERIQRSLKELEDKFDELMSEADQLIADAEEVEKQIAEARARLASPELTQAIQAVQTFSHLMGHKE